MRVSVPQRKLKPSILRAIYIVLISAFTVLGGILVYCGLYHGDTPYNTKLSYSMNEDINYKVNYNDVDIIENPDAELTDTYISGFIKDINSNFSYNYQMDQPGNITYDYSIKGTLVYEYIANSELNDTKVVKKDFPFVDTVKTTLSNVSSLIIDKDVVIDFPTINEEVVNFRETTKLPVTANMEVVFTVNITSEANGEKITNSMSSSMIIPFNTLAFNIKKNIATPINDSIKDYLEVEYNNIKISILGFVLIFVAVVMFTFNFNKIFNIVKKTKYELEIERVLKTNKDIIVNLETPLDEDGLRVVLVTSFNELLDLEDELRVPIHFYEIIHGSEAEFSIINNDVIYKYVYTSDERI